MDIKEIREILKLLERFEILDFSLQEGDTRIHVRRGGRGGEASHSLSGGSVARDVLTITPPPEPSVAAPEPEGSLVVGEKQFLVTSPIVGTFYRAPSPESPSFVEVGSQVSKGSVLCLVEAMKIMNEIESEVGGKVAGILVENAQPVEYGQPLFIIDLV